MDWQQPAALAVVAFTGFLLVRRKVRSRKLARTHACGSAECSCGQAVAAGVPPRPPAVQGDVESQA